MKRVVFALAALCVVRLLAGLATAQSPQAKPSASARESAFLETPSDGSPIVPQASLDSITARDLREHVTRLADDKLEGRKAGTPGGRAAGDYLTARLADLRLRAAGVDGKYDQPFEGGFRNILATLEGSHPSAKREYIVVGAHYDHLGTHTRRPRVSWSDLAGKSVQPPAPVTLIYSGADDNASGVAGVLEIAQAMSLLSKPPRRSVLFAFWDAEEMGLNGSRYWADQPTVPIEQVVFAMNLDMVGRLQDNRLIVWGTGSGLGLRGLAARHNAAAGLSIDFRPSVLTKADDYPLFLKGIPVLFPWTGMHPQWHSPEDHVERLDVEGMRRVVRLAYSIVYDLADRADRPKFREASRRETEENASVPALPPLPKPDDLAFPMGFTCRRHEAEPNALIIVKVVAETPAAAARLRPGDRICQIEGLPAADSLDLTPFFATPIGPVHLLVEREGRFGKLTLDPKPGSLRTPGPYEASAFAHSWTKKTAPSDAAKTSAVGRVEPLPGQPGASVPSRSWMLGEGYSPIRSQTFSPNSRWLLAAGQVWDLAPGEPARVSLGEPIQAVGYAGFSDNGRWLVVCNYGSGMNPGSASTVRPMRLIDMAAARPGAVEIQLDQPQLRAFWPSSGGSRWLFTQSPDGIRLWDLHADNPLAAPALVHVAVEPRTYHHQWLSVSPDGRWLAAAKSLLDLSANRGTGTEITAEFDGVPPLAAISPDGRRAIAGNRLLDLTKPEPPASAMRLSVDEAARAAAFSADGRWLAVAGDAKVRLWELGKPDPDASARELPGPGNGYAQFPFRLSLLRFSPDSRWLVVSSFDGAARLFDLTAAATSGTEVARAGSEKQLSFTADGRWLVAGDNQCLRLWNLKPGTPSPAPIELAKPTGRALMQASVHSEDGRWLAVGDGASPDGGLLLWDLQAASPVDARVVLPVQRAYRAVFSPDGRWLFVRSRGDSASSTKDASETAHLWCLGTGLAQPPKLDLSGHNGTIIASVFSSDGNWLVTNCARGTRLWDLRNIPASPAPPSEAPRQ